MRLLLFVGLAVPLLAGELRGKLEDAPFTRVLLTSRAGAILAETTTNAAGEFAFLDAPADARPVPASRVTVTAIRGAAVDAADSPQVNLAGERIGPTVAHALEAQPNVYLPPRCLVWVGAIRL